MNAQDISRLRKAQLVELVEQWARQHGRQWIIGGPREWSKDELVNAAVRIERGEQP